MVQSKNSWGTEVDIITLDVESYYDQQYSLSKITIEEYVRSDLFEVIGVGVKVNDGDTEWYSGTMDNIKKYLEKFDFEHSLVLAHNAMFDAAILSWRFGRCPAGWLDTISMSRAIHSTEVGNSLAALSEHYGLGTKGNEVISAMGKRRLDFSAEALTCYGEYCKNDVELTWKLFNILAAGFPANELRLIDLTIKMFSEPVLELAPNYLEQHLLAVRAKKEGFLSAVAEHGGKADLMSNEKFASLLDSMDVVVPRKISLRTGKETWAFAKSDEGFKELLDHPNPLVQAVCAARIGVKSTQEETRTERFLAIARRGKLPVPLRYYAAHTGRWGGDEKINLQNLKRDSKLKHAIMAPEGYMVIDSDSSQIEARTVAWLAGQDDLVRAFENGEDVYKIMASAIYGKPEADITKDERFVGKTTILGCFSADTKVLTDNGWKRIVEVQATDMLWDGEEWITHQGVIPKGLREVVTAYGIDATPEHEILTEHGWQEWYEVATNATLFQSALSKANLLSLHGRCTKSALVNLPDITQSLNVPADGKEELTDITSKQGVLHAAILALKKQVIVLARSIGGTKISYLTSSIGRGFSTVSQAVSHVATHLLANNTVVTGDGGLRYTNHGERIGGHSCGTSYRSLDGKTKHVTLTGLTTTKGMNLTTYDLRHDPKTQGIDVQSVSCKKKLMTYDIAYAGPRNRYTIATSAGSIIVHNCGYGMGAVKFRAQLKVYGVSVSEDEAQRIITIYRETYPMIPLLWRKAGKAIEAMSENATVDLGVDGVLVVDGAKGIRLPNGLYLKYPNLRKIAKDDKEEWAYDTKKGRSLVFTRIYGGKLIENICQALARIVIGEQMLMVARKYKVAMTVHDAIACVVPISEVKSAQEYIELCMRIRPSWAQGLPLNCESGHGHSYGDC